MEEQTPRNWCPGCRPIPNVRSVLNVSGYPQRNQGFTIAFLEDRPPRKVSAQKVMAELMPVVNSVPGSARFLFGSSSHRDQHRNLRQPLSVHHAVRGHEDPIPQCPRNLRTPCIDTPQITGVNSNLYIKNPEAFINIYRDKASSLGITAEEIEQSAFSAYGEREISNIYGTTDTYKVDPAD